MYWLTIKPQDMTTDHLLNTLSMLQRSHIDFSKKKIVQLIVKELMSRKKELVDYIGTELCPPRDDPYFIQLMILLDLKDLQYYFEDSLVSRTRLLMEMKCKRDYYLSTPTQAKKK